MKSTKLLLALMACGLATSALAQAGKDNLATLKQMKVSGVDLNIPPVPQEGKNADAIRANLKAQLTGSVRWTQSVLAMVHDGATNFYEVGPGKALQGMMWKDGYGQADFTAHIYEDAAAALQAWKAAGLPLYVYSSGSVPAQRLFFGHSDVGDLTGLISGWFDTEVGGKREAGSYRRIVAALGVPAADVLFLSDVVEELDAAREAADGDAALALRALGWILSDEPRAERLLGLTGLAPADLRASLGEQATLAAILDEMEGGALDPAGEDGDDDDKDA